MGNMNKIVTEVARKYEGDQNFSFQSSIFTLGKLRCISLDVIVLTALMNCGILSRGEALKIMWK